MYLIYVANSTDVHTIANQWGQDHTKLPNGTVQAIHSALSKCDWQATIRSATVKRNPRIVHLTAAAAEDLPAIDLTGMMHDEGFQCIGYVTDEMADAISKAQQEAQRLVAETYIDAMRADMLAAIESSGVMDRLTMVSNKATYNFTGKESAKKIRAIIQGRKEFINEYLAKTVDLDKIVNLAEAV